MFYLTLLAALCLLLLLVPAEYYNLPIRLAATLIFYFLYLLSIHVSYQDALQHRVQVGTRVAKHIDFGGDDNGRNTEPVYDTSSSWLLIVLGGPVLAIVLLRFFNRQARLHPFIAVGFILCLWSVSHLPAWLKP